MALRLSTGFRNKQLGLKTTIGDNATFDTDTTGWTATDANLSSISGGQSNNCLEVAEADGINPGKAYQDFTTIVGRAYKLTVYHNKGTADAGRIMVGTTVDENAIHNSGLVTDASWTKKTILFIATETVTRITLQSEDATAGETTLFDECILDEIIDGFADMMAGCKITLYTGAQPATADNAATGTELVTISLNGGVVGLTWEDAIAGACVKAVIEVWQGTAVAAGTAGWFRCYQSGGIPADADTIMARFDGAVGTSGSQLDMSNTAIANGAVQTVSAFSYTQPAS